MNIEIYALCHQEADIIPYFMRHYKQYGQVFLMEGHSTDGSAELARLRGAIIVPVDTNDEVRDDIFTDIKNNCWKDSKADWVIVCDMDEFVYHPDMINYLSTIKDTIVIPRQFEMITDIYPTTDKQIYDEVRYGFEMPSKMFLFQPQKLKNISYGVGAHSAQPEGEVYINKSSEIICMHMKFLSVNKVIERNRYLTSRFSDINRKNGWGWHTSLPPAAIVDTFNDNKNKLIKVL